MFDRIRNRIERRYGDSGPVLSETSDRFTRVFSPKRNQFRGKINKVSVDLPRKNVGNGMAISHALGGAITVLENTVGVPFGASVSVTGAEQVEGGRKYTVDVNAPFEGVARSRASIDSTTGYTSLLTDNIIIDDVEIVKRRPLRDTYRVELRVMD